MPRYEALVREGLADLRYLEALDAFKYVCAKLFTTKVHTLKERDFFGVRLQGLSYSCDLPPDVDIVFVLHLHDDEERRRFNEDVLADAIVWEMRKQSDLCVRVSLEFSRIGWSFLASEISLSDAIGPGIFVAENHDQ